MQTRSWVVAGMWGMSLAAITVAVYTGASNGLTPQSNGSPLDPRHWTHFVRIGGYGLSLNRVDDIIKDATDSHVFGIETDNDIPGRYESFLEPAEKLRAIKAVAQKAHAVGNYAFVYVAGLECITANADQKRHTLFKDHPDWVQRKLTGEPAVFGGGTAFWIARGDEDVWISPYASEWRKVYMERVRQIAATGIDGIYVDIPYWMTHFEGWENSWASFDDYTVAAFKKKTGLDARTEVKPGDYEDPGFIQWIDFRVETITDFMEEISQNVKAVSPNCVTIAEIYPGIEEGSPRVGADVYQLYPVVDVIAHEYEYGSGDHMAASRTPLDWFGYMTGMYSFRSFAAGRASWMLNYSWDGNKNVDRREAMRNLAMAELMAGANVWDTRGHVMSGSNDKETRKLIFNWIAGHEKTFYSPRNPARPIGIYFSPKTRDYFPKAFIESFRGMMFLLLQSHLEFQIVTPRDMQSFRGNELILPDVRCLSEAELNWLQGFVRSGKALLVAGETGSYDEKRQPRTENPLHKLLGISDPARQQTSTSSTRFIYAPRCPGRAYYAELEKHFNDYAVRGDYKAASFETLRQQLSTEILRLSNSEPVVEIDASPFLSTQIAEVNGKIHVFMANFRGLESNEVAQQVPERNVRIVFLARQKSKLYVLPFLGEVQEFDGAWSPGRMTFTIPEVTKGMVVWCGD
ncbi:MAG TPA: hypothetical protein VEO19_01545 [Terriglobia bacterium]|nr:hypothetical protein [Terriglobia bacterium]